MTVIPKLCTATPQGAVGYFKIFFLNLCVLFFQTSIKLLGQIVIK